MTDTGSGAPAREGAMGGEAAAHAMMVFAGLIFGLNYVVGRWAVGEVPAYTLGFTRWTIGALIILPFAWRYLRNEGGLFRDNWKLLAFAGFAMPFAGAGVTYVALNYTTAVNGSLIQTSLPVLIVLLSWAILGSRATLVQCVGAVIAIAGVFYIIAKGDPEVLLELNFNLGDAILIGCNLGLATYGVIIKKAPKELNPLSLIAIICAFGALYHLPVFAAEIATGQIPRPSTAAIVSLVFVAIFPSVVAIICWNNAIARLGPNRAGFYMYLVPAFAAAFAIPFLGETVGLFHLVGTALIVLGVTLSTRKS